VRGFVEAVKNGEFPGIDAESYSMDHGEWSKLLEAEQQGGST
jgi:hypothetical protein